jgi:hypothetical protein
MDTDPPVASKEFSFENLLSLGREAVGVDLLLVGVATLVLFCVLRVGLLIICPKTAYPI